MATLSVEITTAPRTTSEQCGRRVHWPPVAYPESDQPRHRTDRFRLVLLPRLRSAHVPPRQQDRHRRFALMPVLVRDGTTRLRGLEDNSTMLRNKPSTGGGWPFES